LKVSPPPKKKEPKADTNQGGKAKKSPPPPTAKEEPPDVQAQPEAQAPRPEPEQQQVVTEEPGPEASTAPPKPGVPISVYDVLRFSIRMLYEQAWASLGLVPDPGTGQIKKDLTQARVAVDCVDFLVKQLEPYASPEEKRDLRSLLTTLRLNYVNQSS